MNVHRTPRVLWYNQIAATRLATLLDFGSCSISTVSLGVHGSIVRIMMAHEGIVALEPFWQIINPELQGLDRIQKLQLTDQQP